MKHGDIRARYHAIADRLSARGYRVIIGCAKGGFWVRNPDITKPPFVDTHSFVAFRKAKAMCSDINPGQHGGHDE